MVGVGFEPDPHPALVIRPAVAGDVERIRALVHAAYAVYVPRIGREPAPMTADYEALVASGDTWVAVAGDRVTGVLVMRPVGDELFLENAAVDPCCQRRGIGRALIAFAEGHALALGLAAVTLYTNEAMTENLSMYPALGFVETDRSVESGYHRVYFRKATAPADEVDGGGGAG